MKKIFCILLLLAVSFQFAVDARGIEYNKKQIKHGMYEKIVNGTFGQPELSRDLDPGFLPIPRKRCLYQLEDGDYMVLQFYSGRVSSITILTDVDHDEAVAVYSEGLPK